MVLNTIGKLLCNRCKTFIVFCAWCFIVFMSFVSELIKMTEKKSLWIIYMVNEYRALALQRWRPCNMVWVILCDEIILNVTSQYKWTCREIKMFPTNQCTLCWTVVFLCMLEYWIATAWYLCVQKGGNFG